MLRHYMKYTVSFLIRSYVLFSASFSLLVSTVVFFFFFFWFCFFFFFFVRLFLDIVKFRSVHNNSPARLRVRGE